MSLLGVTINSALPGTHAWIRLPPGVTVIYGKNGSGKTRLLNAVRNLLASEVTEPRRPWVDAVDPPELARWATGRSTPLGSLRGGWFAEYALDLMHYRAPLPPEDRFGELQGEELRFWRHFLVEGVAVLAPPDPLSPAHPRAEMVELALDQLPSWVDQGQMESVLQRGVFSLSPTGQPWGYGRTRSDQVVYLACVPSESPAGVQELLANAAEAWRSALADVDFDPADPLGSLMSARLAAEGDSRFSIESDGTDSWLDLAPPPELIGLRPRPDWAPIPLFQLNPGQFYEAGAHWEPPITTTEPTTSASELDALTELRLLWTFCHQLTGSADEVEHLSLSLLEATRRAPKRVGLTQMRDAVERLAESAGVEASRLLRRLNSEPFDVYPAVFETNDPSHPLVVRWMARLGAHESVAFDELSSGQRRWARFAAQLAIDRLAVSAKHFPANSISVYDGEVQAAGQVAIIDEPESSLHANEIRVLSAHLPALADRVLVASHSPYLLTAHDHVLHADRNDLGGIETSDLSPFARASLEKTWADALGMTLADLLQLARVLVCVEGDHDALVLRALLETIIAQNRAHIVRLNGTIGVQHVAEANLLFGLSEASVLLVLDDLQVPGIVDGWGDVVQALRTDGPDLARRKLTQMRHSLHSSGVFNHTAQVAFGLMESAIELGRAQRLTIFGLERKDILNYLPIEEFLPGYQTWTAAFDAYAQSCRVAGERISGSGFKAWMRDAGAPIHVRGIGGVLARVRAGEVSLDPAAQREFDELGGVLNTLGGSFEVGT